jgi:hypothetical protein
MDFMPARREIPKKGKPRQTLTKMTEAMAVPASLSHPTPCGRIRNTFTSR